MINQPAQLGRSRLGLARGAEKDSNQTVVLISFVASARRFNQRKAESWPPLGRADFNKVPPHFWLLRASAWRASLTFCVACRVSSAWLDTQQARTHQHKSHCLAPARSANKPRRRSLARNKLAHISELARTGDLKSAVTPSQTWPLRRANPPGSGKSVLDRNQHGQGPLAALGNCRAGAIIEWPRRHGRRRDGAGQKWRPGANDDRAQTNPQKRICLRSLAGRRGNNHHRPPPNGPGRPHLWAPRSHAADRKRAQQIGSIAGLCERARARELACQPASELDGWRGA